MPYEVETRPHSRKVFWNPCLWRGLLFGYALKNEQMWVEISRSRVSPLYRRGWLPTALTESKMRDYGTARRTMFSPSDGCGPLHKADEALCNQVQCTKSFPLSEAGVKRRKPAPSRLPCTGTGLSASYGSLSRAAAMTHSAVRGDVAGTIDRESPVVLHTIFRRPLGSRISSVKVR